MKLRFRQYHRRSFVPLGAFALAAYYVLVFVPIQRHAVRLDGPLQRSGQRLAASMEQTNAASLDFLHITNQLRETRQALDFLKEARQKALARIETDSALQSKMYATFQLVDFENERSKGIEDLRRLAKQSQVTLDSAVLDGLPEFTVDVHQPALLWAALSLADGLLRSAIQCKIASIHSLSVPLPLNPTGAERVWEIPIEIEFSGPAANTSQLLQSLPLRGDEMRAAGWTNAPAQKPAMFIDRVLLKKQSSEKLDDVRVTLRAAGFIYREQNGQ
jgi:hypothetical protein